ncbi:hypothetical protein [Methylobacterium sp. Leaf361]|uniref:hypothetical protein n=1 Tax=Methylobacterium sp. Leaf361 TaxID=1736352 RepID=UPI000AC1C7EA|nr:hypothetical protein [Methylobacterium sp. Leaf361]
MGLEQIFSRLDFYPVMEKSDDRCWAALDRLADALGISRERFFVEAPHAGTTVSTDECLRLWSEIETEEGRRQALQALQTIVRLEEASRSKNL